MHGRLFAVVADDSHADRTKQEHTSSRKHLKVVSSTELLLSGRKIIACA
jgi:hypothetical protein